MERTGDFTVRITIILALILALSAISFGQGAGLTAVTGRVTDSTGAVIPGVTVAVTNTATGASREVISNEQGIYAATQLQPGTYNVKAELPGFKPNVANNVVLPVDQTVTLNFPMSVANTSEVVTVESSAEVVNTENAQLGNNFSSKEILDLPLNARNIVGLLSLQAGVSANPTDANGNTAGADAQGHSTTAGFVNGARNDQQNIVLDGVDNNQFQNGGAFTGVLPTTLDSVQEFIVQTSGQNAASSRSSGAQVQLVTRSGGNAYHGSLYEAYRSKVTTATPYFNGQATPKPGLIRNIPGGSIGGPVIKNKLFFFGAFERHTDRSQTSVTRTVPNATYLQGIFRYQRTAAAVKADGNSYGTITQGCGGMLEKITNVSCDTVNPALFGANGYLQQYANYVNNPGQYGGHIVCPADCSNFANFTFNAPNIVNANVYISRWDYTINSKNTVYVRGTLNNSAIVGAPTFPDKNNGVTTYDNSKGFSASLNSVLTPRINNNFTAGLTRQDGNTTGAAAVVYSFGPSNPLQTTGATRQAIDSWNFVDNLSFLKGAHNWTAGVNFTFINNNVKSYSQVSPGNFSSAANYTTGDFATTCSLTCGPALGADYANVNNYSTLENNILQGIGALNLFTAGLQWDKNGNLLPTGSPFERVIRMDQYDFYMQDSWKMKPNFTFNYGIHWGVMTPPWEKNGNEVNFTQSLRARYNTQKASPYSSDQMPLLATQLAGRANGLPDYYTPALDNWAPRASFAYSPKFTDGVLGTLTNKGGAMAIRGGYSLSFDHTGGTLAYNAATSGGIGLFTSQQFGASQYSINGNAQPAVPRVSGTGSNLVLPYNSFPVSGTQSFALASSTGGWGSAGSVPGIDNGLRPPSNHLLNFTISKELPGGFVIEASYVGRYARDLMGQLDLANPVNIVDKASGQDYYSAIAQIMQYEAQGVGGYQTITAANAAQATASIPVIPWFEGAYSGFKQWAQTGTVNGVAGKDTANAFPGVTFQNGAQAFYAVLNKGLKPGPNTPVILTNATEAYELDTNQHLTTNGQTQSFFLNTNVGKSNYNAGQFSVRKRFAEGYAFTMNYTWSRSMDYTSASESFGTRPGGSGSVDQILDPYHPEKNYAPSTFDRKSSLNGNFVAELPFGTGKLIGGGMGNKLNQIFGGWAVSGIWNAASGTPYTYQAALRYTLHYNGLDKPIPTQQIPTGLNHGFNSAHTIPMVYWIKDQEQTNGAGCDAVCAQTNRLNAVNQDPSKGPIYFTNTYPNGAVARNYVRGPGFWNVDASVKKSFRVTEKVAGTFSADAFNVFNHPNFANPSNVNIDATNGLLGNITSLQGANRVMQFNMRFAF